MLQLHGIELCAEKECRELGDRKELPVYEVNLEEKQTVIKSIIVSGLRYQVLRT